MVNNEENKEMVMVTSFMTGVTLEKNMRDTGMASTGLAPVPGDGYEGDY